MTKETKLIKTALEKNFTYDKDVDVKFISGYKFTNTFHYEFAITEFKRTKMLVVIEYEPEKDVYEIWNIINLEPFYRRRWFDKVNDTIRMLNSGDAE